MPPATPPAPTGTVRRARFAELSNDRLYAILRLRSEVFVVEQACVFLDLDGRDREPDAEHLWVDDGAQAHLADWYARFGFAPAGAGYVEDGIPHVPMARSLPSGAEAAP